jgi:hypothetical protein
MAVKITQSIIKRGHQEGGNFKPTGQPGDWFITDVGVDWPDMDRPLPRVIVTPILEDESPQQVEAMPVCVVRNMFSKGFTLAARNAAHSPGFAAFNWMAVRASPDANPAVVRMAQSVTPYGSRLTARNSDSGSAQLRFWRGQDGLLLEAIGWPHQVALGVPYETVALS